MRVVKCELLRFRLPFRRGFAHATAERSGVDSIGVVLEDEGGRRGFGEILARPYVSGESNDEIFASGGPALAEHLLGRSFSSQEALVRFLEGVSHGEAWGPALYSGFELALINLWEQGHAFDFGAVLGSRRTSPVGRCLTIGFETPREDLPKRARLALLSKASVIKMKVGQADDVERLQAVRAAVGDRVELRLDANGVFGFDEALALLRDGRDLAIGSLEQPFAKTAPGLDELLERLYALTGVPLVADESLCTPEDARRWASERRYQIFNVRVGKSGLLGVAEMMRVAREHDVGLVAGTMVGEAGVLNRASEVLLLHAEDLRYVEGLGQNSSLLLADPYERTPDHGLALDDWHGHATFRLRAEVVEQYLVDRQTVQRSLR